MSINYLSVNNLKVSKFLPNTKVRIVSNEILKDNPPDILIIFAWNFINEIKKKLKHIAS